MSIPTISLGPLALTPTIPYETAAVNHYDTAAVNHFVSIQQDIDKKNYAEAIKNLLFVLHRSDILEELYKYLFLLLPYFDRSQIKTLWIYLPLLLEHSAHLPDKQCQLALKLGSWFFDNPPGLELNDCFLASQEAMNFYSKAIQIAEEKAPTLKQEAHQAASKLLINIIRLSLIEGGKFQRFMENSRTIEEFTVYFSIIGKLKRFCSDDTDKAVIQTLYGIARDTILKRASKDTRKDYNPFNEEIFEGIMMRFSLPSEPITERYSTQLKNFRKSFPTYLEPVRDKQLEIFEAFKKVFKETFLDDIFTILGPPPCDYDIRAMGSIGRQELCPYSDIEYFILIEKDRENTRSYFKVFKQLLELMILSLGETGSLYPVFRCIHIKNPSGFHSDPGNADDRLIGTPEAIALLQKEKAERPNTVINTLLKSVTLDKREVSGSSLFKDYTRHLQGQLDLQHQAKALTFFARRLEDYQERWGPGFSSQAGSVNIKLNFIELLHYLLNDFSLYWRIDKANSLDIVRSLDELFSAESLQLLEGAISFIYALRVQLHLKYNEQKDEACYGEGDLPKLYIKLEEKEGLHLEKIYWLILKPLYYAVGQVVHIIHRPAENSPDLEAYKNLRGQDTIIPLADEKRIRILKAPEEIFKNFDLIETAFECVMKDASLSTHSLKFFIHHLVTQLLATHASYDTHKKFFQKLSQQEKYEPLRTWYLDKIEAAAKEQVKQFASDHQDLNPVQEEDLKHYFAEVWEAHLELTSRDLPQPSYDQAIHWLKTRQIMKRLSLIPNLSTGLRPFLVRQETSLKEALEAMTTTEHPSDTVAVKISAPFLLGTRYLKAEVINQILVLEGKDKGCIKRAYGDLKNGGSAHAVSPALFDGYALHFKERPSHPLMDYAIHNLYSRIGGSLISSGVLVRFEVAGQPYPVWVTETIPGETLKAWKGDPTSLDLPQLTWLLLGELLTRPGDGGLSNYIVGPQNKLHCIDPEAAFVEPVVRNQVFGFKTAPIIQFYSALFCLLKEDTPLDQAVLDQFADLDIGTILLAWIDDLIQKEKEYQSLFPEKDLFLDKERTRPFLPTILFREGTVSTLYLQFWSLQRFIKNQKNPITVSSLLGEIISIREDFQTKNPVGPLIQQKYSKAIKATSDLEKRLMQIRSQQESLSWQQYVRAALALEQIPSENAIAIRREFSPEKAKEELLMIVLRNSEYFFISKKGDKIGIGADFKSIIIGDSPDIKQQHSLLVTLAKIISLDKEKISSLTFRNCAVLNSAHLLPFLHLGLEYIAIDHCESFGQPEIELIQNKCCHMKELHISHCPTLTAFAQRGVFVFASLSFPMLEKLNIEYCDSLKYLQLRSLVLKKLNALDNPKLENVELFLPERSKVAFKGCPPTLKPGRVLIGDKDLSYLKGMPLQSLDLSECTSITDAGLAQLKGMPLQSLDLSECKKITDTGLAQLKGMPLRSLKLSSCEAISDVGLIYLKKMPLQSLDLSDCKIITDAGLAHLEGMLLQSLDLSGCKNITDAGLAHLKGMLLQSLDLTDCNITGAGLAKLKGMPLQSLKLSSLDPFLDQVISLYKMPLKSLVLKGGNKFTSLIGLLNMPLNSLDISLCKGLEDSELKFLKGMPLQSLNLSDCENINDGTLSFLKGLPLEFLDLSRCRKITDDGLFTLKGLPLHSLNLSNCNKITDEGLDYLKGMPLRSLDLSNCNNITDAGLAHLQGMSLQSLNLANCSKLTDEGLAYLKGMPLQHLNLSGFYRSIYDFRDSKHGGLVHLKGLPLQSLDLSGSGLPDTELAYLSGMPLQSLNLAGCENITGQGLTYVEGMPLQSLNLNGCSKFNPHLLGKIAIWFPDLDINQVYKSIDRNEGIEVSYVRGKDSSVIGIIKHI